MSENHGGHGLRYDRNLDSGAIQINPLDNIMPRFHASIILTFGIPSDRSFQDIHHILQRSLNQTCDAIPVLGSKIFAAKPTAQNPSTGRLEVRNVRGWHPELIFNDLSESLPDYEGLLIDSFPQSLMDAEKLLPRADQWDTDKTGIPVIICQANYVEFGLLLAVGVYHSVIDGAGATLFLKIWAQNARFLQNTAQPGPKITLHPDSYDLSLLERISASEKDGHCVGSCKVEAEYWRLLGLFPPVAPGHTITASSPMPKMASKMFYISSNSFQQLIATARSNPSLSSDMLSVTGNDALMALLWRCSIRARAQACNHPTDEYNSDTLAYLDTTINGRSLIGDPLPWSYMGTLIFFATASMTVGELVDDSTDLRQISRKFRNAADSITKDHVLKAYVLASSLQDYEHVPQHPYATMRGTEVFVTSWITFDILDVSFGEIFSNGGRADCARIPRLQFGGYSRRIVVLPRQKTGALEVLIELQDEEMIKLELDGEFTKFAKVM